MERKEITEKAKIAIRKNVEESRKRERNVGNIRKGIMKGLPIFFVSL